MNIISKQSIQTKLVFIALTTSLVTLLITNVSFLVLEYYHGKKDILEKIDILGQVISERSTAAIAFQDSDQLKSNLKALEAESGLIRTCIYNDEGKLITQHRKSFDINNCHGEKSKLNKVKNSNFSKMHTIVLDEQIIGYLFIEVANKNFVKRFNSFLFYSVGIIIISIFLSLILIDKLKNLISTPLMNLARAINKILSENDYSIRAKKEHDDELGHLVDTFNVLFSTIESDNESLKESEDKFKKLTNLSPVGIFQVDIQGKIIYTNQTWIDINKTTERIDDVSEWIGIVHPDDKDKTKQKVRHLITSNEEVNIESRIIVANNTTLWVSVQLCCLFHSDNSVAGYLGSLSDISELKNAQLQMENLAFYDPLTGLANRRLFKNRLESSIHNLRNGSTTVALMFLDLDQFKKVNDTLGHDFGDALLKEIADRITASVRASDTVSRVGGDEFTIVLTGIEHNAHVHYVAQKILHALQRPIIIQDQEIINTVSIGITLAPEDSRDINTLMKNADLAMYKAKEAGRNNYKFYSEEMNIQATERLSLEKDLAAALKRNQFYLVYQPKICLKTQKAMGVEALIRWQHPTKGLICPDDFISIAEDTDDIISIGAWVLEESCRTMRYLIDNNLMDEGAQIAVNLSAKQFNDNNIAQTIINTLAKCHLPNHCLELEITESTLVDDVDKSIKIMKKLQDSGINFAIDDFGTGYSSLNYLKRFPIDILKVDRSFVMDIPGNENDMAITAAVTAMAHKLGLKVVAEGVETEEQMQFLIDNKCNYGQGYYFSKPLILSDLEQFLTERKAYKR